MAARRVPAGANSLTSPGAGVVAGVLAGVAAQAANNPGNNPASSTVKNEDSCAARAQGKARAVEQDGTESARADVRLARRVDGIGVLMKKLGWRTGYMRRPATDGLFAALSYTRAHENPQPDSAPAIRLGRRPARFRDVVDDGVPLLFRPQPFWLHPAKFFDGPVLDLATHLHPEPVSFHRRPGPGDCHAAGPKLGAVLAPMGAGFGRRPAGVGRLLLDVPADLHLFWGLAWHGPDAGADAFDGRLGPLAVVAGRPGSCYWISS